MAAAYDIGASIAQSLALKSGEVTQGGDIILGGSGGAGKTPSWLWIGLVAFGVVALLFLFARGKGR